MLLFHTIGASAQLQPLKSNLLTITSISDSINHIRPPEKLYLQFDKRYYATNDTAWFKAYLLNNFLLPSTKSGLLNIDIANDSNKVVKQYRLPVQSGLTWGNISLNDKDFKPGTYLLRAYTNWMRNFGEDCFFYKTFTIINADNGQLLVNTAYGNLMIRGNPSIETKLHFRTMADLPFAVQPVTLQVMNDNKHLFRQKYLTGVDGGLDVNFSPPQKPNHLTLVAENDKKERLAVIPVPVNRLENADVQFLPEGGNLVAGLPAHVGFKAIGEDGKGLDVSGVILDHTQKQVAAFKSLHQGMGSVDLYPNEGETYMAQVTLPGGLMKQCPLPIVKSIGTMLTIKNEMADDSLIVTVSATKDTVTSGRNYFLIGRARGIVCYAAVVCLRENNSISKKIAKSLFPTGIAHFTLMTTRYQPVNERLVYIDLHDNLVIKLSTSKFNCSVRDSVGLKLKVSGAAGHPIAGNFSMAVTDDVQVKPDTLNVETINTRFLLTGDLKGYIEQPVYYLSSKNPKAWQALDNLLLTQGWVGYDWSQVLTPLQIAYPPERDFTVSGYVTNVMNKPVGDAHVMLFSKSPAMIIETVTSKGGQFVFDHLPRVDTPAFVLKAMNKNGKSFNVNIKLDELTAPGFTAHPYWQPKPWYVNTDSTLITYNKRAALIHQQQEFTVGGHILKEVKIIAKKIIPGSQNLNGSGNADIVLDEKDLLAAGKKNWLQLFQEKIPGFKEGIIYRHGAVWFFIQDIKNPVPLPKGEVPNDRFMWYYIHDKPIKIYVDGVSVTELYPTPTSQVITYAGGFQNMNNFLNSTSVEDIKGMEVSFTDKYSGTYIRSYTHSTEIHMDDVAFIDITTRSGRGPLIDNTPGMYLYKPLPLSYPKQFYKPKYTVKDTAQNHLDLRATIDWEPNIVTDAKGEAKVWFYTADKPSTYTVTVEGTDMNGHFGFAQSKIKVEAGKDKTK